MLGRWVSDLEEGDVLPTVAYEATPFLAREYAHAIESGWERFHGASGDQPQVTPPTVAHIDKLRVLAAGCPEGAGPVARVQVEYDAQHFGEVPVGSRILASGFVESRHERRGREYIVVVFEVREAETGALLTRYRDTSLLNYAPKETN
jgi:hypothetical protein